MTVARACILILAVLLLGLPPSGMPVAEEPGQLPPYTDSTGARLDFYQDAQRIVSLAPNVTEMICYAGLGDRLVGRSDFCDYPPEVLDLPSVGGFVDTSLEAIVAVKPDLVVAYQGNSRELVDQLRALDITVLAFNEAASLMEIGEQIVAVQMLAGPRTVAKANPVRELIEELAMLPLSREKRFTVFYGYPGELMYTCAPGTFIDDLITRAGGSNIVADDSVSWPQVSAEFVVAANPNYILTSTSCTDDQDPTQVRAELIKKLQTDAFWSKLTAVRDGQVIVIDSDLLNRPGPRIIQAYEQLIDQLNPHDRPAANLEEPE